MTSVRPLFPAPLWREDDRRERIRELARDGHEVEQALVRLLADEAQGIDVLRHLVEEVGALQKGEGLGALALVIGPAGRGLGARPARLLGRLLGLDEQREEVALDDVGRRRSSALAARFANSVRLLEA